MTGHRWFAFLRAINTGNRRVTNTELLAPFEALGFADVAAYQAAGNVTFCADGPLDEQAIAASLAEAYGFEVPVFVRSADEVSAVATSQPFSPDELAATAGKVQVSFLRDKPSAEQLATLAELTPADDRVRVIGREWFWLPVDGISASKLPVVKIEQVLGELTMRTLGTLRRMLAKFP